MKYKQMNRSIRYTLIFLQIIGLILGIASLALSCHAYANDVRWNNIVLENEKFPHLFKENYFNRRKLEWHWIDNDTDEDTKTDINILKEGLLRDSVFDPLFISGLVLVTFVAIFHLMWTFVYELKCKNLKMTVWLSLGECLFQLLLSIIVALTAGDNDQRMKVLKKDLEERSDDQRIIGIETASERNLRNDITIFKSIYSICLGHYNSTGFVIPGYEFWYDKGALTKLGFCPESDVKFSAAICASFYGVLLGITAFAAQMAVWNAFETACRNQVVPEQRKQGIKLKTLPTTVFGARTLGFGQFDHTNLAERRECLSRRFSHHPFPRFPFPDSSIHIGFKGFAQSSEDILPENSFTNTISD